MDRIKGFFSSKTIWSQLVGIIAAMVTIWGVDLDAETQAAIVSVIVALQGLFGMIFRTAATKQVAPPLASTKDFTRSR